MALNPRQARFVAEYLKDLKAGPAAERAGYSAATAETCGPRLLRNVQVSLAVNAALAKQTGKLELSAEKVLANIERLGKLAEDAGDLGVALKGQELLGKHLKLFTDKTEHSGDVRISVVDPYAVPR